MLPDILKVFYSITAFQLLFFSLVVLSIKPFKKYQYWLSGLLFVEFLNLFIHIGRWIYYFLPDNHLSNIITFILEYSICPVFLLFVIKISAYKVKINFKTYLLIIPYLIGFTFIYIPQEQWVQHAFLFHIILSINYYGQALFYAFIAYKIYKKFQENMGNYVAQNSMQQLYWLKLVIIGFLILWLLAFTFNFSAIFISYKFPNTNLIIEIFYLVAINIMLFIAVTRTNGIQSIILDSAESANANKYATSSLSDIDKEMIIDKLKTSMADYKIYKTPNITLKLLAGELSLQTKHLSQVINEYFNMNFCEYINSLRIEDAKEQLIDPKNEYKTILEIIYDTGFNSKSVFNTVFKKQTGVTPTSFKLKHMPRN